MSQISVLQYNNTGSNNTATVQPAAGRPLEVTAEQKVSDKGVDKVSINEAVRNINAALTTLRRDERQFSVDEDLGRLVVKIVNTDTKEIVRQIPSEEALTLSKKMQEMIKLLFD